VEGFLLQVSLGSGERLNTPSGETEPCSSPSCMADIRRVLNLHNNNNSNNNSNRPRRIFCILCPSGGLWRRVGTLYIEMPSDQKNIRSGKSKKWGIGTECTKKLFNAGSDSWRILFRRCHKQCNTHRAGRRKNSAHAHFIALYKSRCHKNNAKIGELQLNPVRN